MNASNGTYLDRFRLDGQAAVITGASRGIGAAIARGFAEAGADLLLVARSRDPLEEKAQEIRTVTGQRVITIALDITETSASESIAIRARKLPSPITILVNNAYSNGDNYGTTIFDTEDNIWMNVLNTNLLAPFRLCRTFGKLMLQGGGGNLINVVSGSGFTPTPTLGPYGSSKAALWAMTKYLAIEGAPHVRANAICPGIIDESGLPRNQAHEALLNQVPLGRIGTPDEVVGAAIYLASNASTYTTGSMVVVNGGRPI